MAYTATTFKAAYTEFANVADARVTLELANATRRCNATVFGDDFDAAVALLTAHLLSLSPFGQRGTQDETANTTRYWDEWKRLARARAGGPWVTGQNADGTVDESSE